MRPLTNGELAAACEAYAGPPVHAESIRAAVEVVLVMREDESAKLRAQVEELKSKMKYLQERHDKLAMACDTEEAGRKATKALLSRCVAFIEEHCRCSCPNPEPHDWPHDPADTNCTRTIATAFLAEIQKAMP